MIIECINCNRKFDVNSELIPSTGRTIQCGSCNHVWFFNPSFQKKIEKKEPEIVKKTIIESKKNNIENKGKQPLKKIKKNNNEIHDDKNKKNYELAPYKPKFSFSLSKLLSYIIVLIISFIALIILIDTFKLPLYRTFPELEIIIFSLFEILKDMKLFIKDLI